MIKLSNCKELDIFDHYDILDHIDNLKYNKAIKQLKSMNKEAVKIEGNNGNFSILHGSSKENGLIQISNFKVVAGETVATGDKEINIKSNLQDLKEYIIKNYYKIIKR